MVLSPFSTFYSALFQIQSAWKYIYISFLFNFPAEDCRIANNRLSVSSLSLACPLLLCSYFTCGSFYLNLSESKGLTPPAKKQISFLRCLITAFSSKCHQTAIKQQAPWTKTQWCITQLIRCTLFWKGHYS